jgi:hypothetical protein
MKRSWWDVLRPSMTSFVYTSRKLVPTDARGEQPGTLFQEKYTYREAV